jgi:hypothetical protein
MKTFYSGDFAGWPQKNIKQHLIDAYQANKDMVDAFDIIVAWQDEGPYGCDSSSFFLLKKKKTGQLFEVHGSHCSCYGFEGQFQPEPTTAKYLLSEKFTFSLSHIQPFIRETFGLSHLQPFIKKTFGKKKKKELV